MQTQTKKVIDKSLLKIFYARDAIKLQIEQILKASNLFSEIIFESRRENSYYFTIDGTTTGFLSAREAEEFIL